MRPRNHWLGITVWLLATAAVIVAWRAGSTVVHAGPSSAQQAKPAAGIAVLPGHLLAVPQAATMVPASGLSAEAAERPMSATGSQPRPDLPPVEEFILTPPNTGLRVYKTTLSLRFAAGAARRLPALVTTNLGNQNVVLARSSSDPDIFSATIDFKWDAFVLEQQRRKSLSDNGQLVPVFDAHRLLRMEPMQFVDPEEVREALQSHHSISFTPHVLQGDTTNIIPSRELMVTSIGVVEDPIRTWDPCAKTGKPMSPWTFGALMTAIANDDPSTHL